MAKIFDYFSENQPSKFKKCSFARGGLVGLCLNPALIAAAREVGLNTTHDVELTALYRLNAGKVCRPEVSVSDQSLATAVHGGPIDRVDRPLFSQLPAAYGDDVSPTGVSLVHIFAVAELTNFCTSSTALNLVQVHIYRVEEAYCSPHLLHIARL